MSTVFTAGVFALIFALFLTLVPIALLVALQVWLSRRGPGLGLILPVLSLVLSLVMVFSVAAFSRGGGGGSYISSADGQTVQVESPGTSWTPGVYAALAGTFLVANIPTAVFGGIWLHYKGREDLREELKRMRLEDLE